MSDEENRSFDQSKVVNPIVDQATKKSEFDNHPDQISIKKARALLQDGDRALLAQLVEFYKLRVQDPNDPFSSDAVVEEVILLEALKRLKLAVNEITSESLASALVDLYENREQEAQFLREYLEVWKPDLTASISAKVDKGTRLSDPVYLDEQARKAAEAVRKMNLGHEQGKGKK